MDRMQRTCWLIQVRIINADTNVNVAKGLTPLDADFEIDQPMVDRASVFRHHKYVN